MRASAGPSAAAARRTFTLTVTRSSAGEQAVEGGPDAVGVLAVLADGAQGGGRRLDVELVAAERHQAARPVEALGDAGRLEQVRTGGPGGAVAQPLGRRRATCSASRPGTSGRRVRRICTSRASPGCSTQW